jgi:hypothetical protein
LNSLLLRHAANSKLLIPFKGKRTHDQDLVSAAVRELANRGFRGGSLEKEAC